MKKSVFLEAKSQIDIIDACDDILLANEEDNNGFSNLVFNNDPDRRILRLLDKDKQIQRSFLRWVEREKNIAEEKLSAL